MERRADSGLAGGKAAGPSPIPQPGQFAERDFHTMKLGDRDVWTFIKLFFLHVYLDNFDGFYKKLWHFEFRNKPSVREL